MNEVVAVKASVLKPDGVITLLDYNNKMASTMRDKTKGFISGVDRGIDDVARRNKEKKEAEENIKRAERDAIERAKKAERDAIERAKKVEKDKKDNEERLIKIAKEDAKAADKVMKFNKKYQGVNAALKKLSTKKTLDLIENVAIKLYNLFEGDSSLLEAYEIVVEPLAKQNYTEYDELDEEDKIIERNEVRDDIVKAIDASGEASSIVQLQVLELISLYAKNFVLRKKPTVAPEPKENDIVSMIFDKAPKDIMLSVSEFLIGESKASKLFKEDINIKEYGNKILEAEIEGRPKKIELAMEDITKFFLVSDTVDMLNTYESQGFDDSEYYDGDEEEIENLGEEGDIDFSILSNEAASMAEVEIIKERAYYERSEQIRIYKRIFEHRELMIEPFDSDKEPVREYIVAAVRNFVVEKKKYSFRVIIEAFRLLNKKDSYFEDTFTQFLKTFIYLKDKK